MIGLLDYDSLIYKSVYRVVSIEDLRRWIAAERGREWIEEEIKNLSINRLCNMGDALFEAIEETGITLDRIEYFITTAREPFRKKVMPEYKAKRKKNKWVRAVRNYLIERNLSETCNEFEADDLIADRAAELKPDEYIVISLDKDLKQIPGLHFDYYMQKDVNEQGDEVRTYRGLDLMSREDAEKVLWGQMVSGDAGDGVQGIKGCGPVKAKKMLAMKNYKREIISLYKQNYAELWKQEFRKNWSVLKLGKKWRKDILKKQLIYES